MRRIILILAMLSAASGVQASQAAVLTDGRARLAEGDSVAAEALFQQIVEASDADPAEVEEALFWQLMIYSGDFLAAMALLQPIQAAVPGDHPVKKKIAQQMGFSRWAFFVASGNYLNATVMGSELGSIKGGMPDMGNDDVKILLATLASPETLSQVLDGYQADKSVTEGLIQRIGQYSMYLAVSDALPGLNGKSTTEVHAGIGGGVAFSQAHFLDWMARVAGDMDQLVREPNGPDLPGIAVRCSERISKLRAGGRPGQE